MSAPRHNKRIAILGTGQLGRMMAVEAHRLGLDVVGYGPAAGPMMDVVRDVIVAPWDDAESLQMLASSTDAFTWELEHLPMETVRSLARTCQPHPSLLSLQTAQDRLLEKRFVESLQLPVARFASIESIDDIATLADDFPFPAILKTRTGGYDGKGQVTVRSRGDLEAAWQELGRLASVLEERLQLRREVSAIAVRSVTGEVRSYAPVENLHREGILRWSLAPALAVDEAHLDHMSTTLLHALDYVGVLTTEMFDTEAQPWVVNELAPRVHNSGHWTIEGAATSQFENHIRAVAGLPLGSTSTRSPSLMVNIIGHEPRLQDLARIEGARIHLYNKSERPGRKLGHVTITSDSRERLLERGRDLLALVGEDPEALA